LIQFTRSKGGESSVHRAHQKAELPTGATTIEYALIAAGISIVIVAAMITEQHIQQLSSQLK